MLLLRNWHLCNDEDEDYEVSKYLPSSTLKLHFSIVEEHHTKSASEPPSVVYELLDNRAISATSDETLLTGETSTVVVSLFDSRRVHPLTQGILYAAVQTGRMRIIAARPEDQVILQSLRIPFDPIEQLVTVLKRPSHQRYISGLKLITRLTENRRYEIVDTDIIKVYLTDHVHIFIASGERTRHFFTSVRPSTTPFVLVTHNSDVNIDESYLRHVVNAPNNMLAWFTENLCIPPTHAHRYAIHCLPMGIANSGWPHGDMDALATAVVRCQRVLNNNKNNVKNDGVYLGCDVATNPRERKPLKDNLAGRYGWQDQRMSYREYLHHLASSFSYCFCPAGVAIDTHRFWECQYLGVTPIVKRNAWSAHWRDKLPMIEVDDWNDFEQRSERNDYQHNSVGTYHFTHHLLDVEYYVRAIVTTALEHPRVTGIYNQAFVSMKHRIHVCVVSNKPENKVLRQMQCDARDLGWTSFHVLSEPDMKIGHGIGHGIKVLLLQKFLDVLQRSSGDDDDSIILFLDAHDVRLMGSPSEVFTRFKRTKTRILFSAEKNCWPDVDRAPQFVFDPTSHRQVVYRYLNSGGYIGYVNSLLKLFKDNEHVYLDNATDDQRYFTTLYLRHQREPERIKLDTRCELFQCLFLAHADVCPSSLMNKVYGTRPVIFHGNGGNSDGDTVFNQLVITRHIDAVPLDRE